MLIKHKGMLSYAFVLAFLIWCAIAFRADIAQIKLAPILAAKEFIFLAALLSLFNYAARVFRWSLYLAKLGHPIPLGFAGLTYLAGFAFTLSPGKVGEMVRGRYYQKIGIPMSNTAAAFFIERLMDLLAMLGLTFLALAGVSSYDGLIWGAVIIIGLLLALMALAPWESLLAWLNNSSALPVALRGSVQAVLRTLVSAKVLLRPSMLFSGFAIGLVAWGAEGVGLMLIGGIAPAIPLDWATATGIYSVAIIVGALSFLPGGLGSTEAVMIGLLAAHGYAMPDAIALTLVCRLLTLWFAVLIGWGAVLFLRQRVVLS